MKKLHSTNLNKNLKLKLATKLYIATKVVRLAELFLIVDMLADKFTKHRPLTSGVVFNLINLATITFLSLISLPFYLKILGAETFGIYTMIVVVPTALSIFSPGITTSVTYHVAKAINNDRRKQLDLIILTGLICHFI